MKCESPIERMLYFAMLDRGIIPVCQYWIGNFRVDFAILEERIVVEADGKAYHSKPAQQRRDKAREDYLKLKGWRVIRFTGSEIWNDSDQCAKKIGRLIRGTRPRKTAKVRKTKSK